MSATFRTVRDNLRSARPDGVQADSIAEAVDVIARNDPSLAPRLTGEESLEAIVGLLDIALLALDGADAGNRRRIASSIRSSLASMATARNVPR